MMNGIKDVVFFNYDVSWGDFMHLNSTSSQPQFTNRAVKDTVDD